MFRQVLMAPKSRLLPSAKNRNRFQRDGAIRSRAALDDEQVGAVVEPGLFKGKAGGVQGLFGFHSEALDEVIQALQIE